MDSAERSADGSVNLTFAVMTHVVAGLILVGGLYVGLRDGLGEGAAIIWGASACALWYREVELMRRERSEAGRVWSRVLQWWFEALVAPFALAFVAVGSFLRVETRLTAVEAELHELRAPAPTAEPAEVPRPDEWLAPKPRPEPASAPAPPPRVAPAPRPAPASRSGDVNVSDLLGARTLAWAGGVVTLLGIVLLFGLAVNRGWIGPAARVGLGAFASAIVFGAGWWLQRRYGQTYSALAAVGAGIAGGYASLLAAAALYDLVPSLAALAIAAGIAAVGVATALIWSSQIVAGIGLIGAILVPVAVVFNEGRLSILGTTFVALMVAGTGVVGVARRWRALLVCAAAASLPQIAAVVVQSSDGSGRATALAAAFAAIYAGIGVALELRRERPGLDGFAATFVLAGAVVAGGAALLLYSGRDQGIALLIAAGPLGLSSAWFFSRARDRDLSALLAALALGLGAVAFADLLSGPVLAVAWSAEAAVLAWLADRTAERRFQVGAFAYLTLAATHVFAYDAPVTQFFSVSSEPARGILAVIAAAAAAAIAAAYARPGGSTGGVFAKLDKTQEEVRIGLGSAAGVLAMYAASLGVLELAIQFGGDRLGAFQWGHVAVTGMLGLVGFAVLVAGLRNRARVLEAAGLAWLSVALAKHLLYDLPQLAAMQRSYASLAVAAVGLAVAVAYQLLKRQRSLSVVAAVAELISAGLAVSAAIMLVGGHGIGGAGEGAALLGIAAAYGLTSAVVLRRHRDLSTLLWVTSLVIATCASPELLTGTWLVVAWSVAAAALALIAAGAGEARLLLGSLALLGLGLCHALVLEAPPSDLFVASGHPGSGVPALLSLAAAAAAVLALARKGGEGELPVLDGFRRYGAWAIGWVLFYAASLSILELAEAVGTAGVSKDFQHGQTVVSAVWGVLGLIALYVGLRRRSRAIRLGGFALFGVSLAKLFLYDLAALNSITRALSFLAVGALLLLGGFFYQRLSSELEERPLG